MSITTRFIAWLLMSGLGATSLARVVSADSAGWLSVRIVNHQQANLYRISLPTMESFLVADELRKSGTIDPLAKIIQDVKAKRASRRNAAAGFEGTHSQPIRWADVSPDKKYTLVGFEDPVFESMTTAQLVRKSDGQVVSSVEVEGIIRGSLWLPDSSAVAILESTERMRKTPYGLLAALSGHPIRLQTFYLRLLVPTSAEQARIEVTGGVENATADLEWKLEAPIDK